MTSQDTMTTREQSLRAKVRELCADWDYEPRCDAWGGEADPDFSQELGRRGLLALTWPKDLGGAAESNLTRLAVTEELLRAGAPVSYHWAGERQIGPTLIRHGSRALQDEFCPRLARAEISFALGMSEPDAGSDLAAVRTTATRTDEGWVVNGRKVWTSGAHFADYLYVLARTSKSEDRHAGLSEFVVDTSAPGVHVQPIIGMDGGHHFNEVVFDEVHVPDRWLIGTEGHGWQQVISQLAFERGGPERFLSMYPLLGAVLDTGVLDDTDRAALRGLTAQLTVLRSLARNIAADLDAGRSPVAQAATSKYLGNRLELAMLDFVRPLLSRCDGRVRAMFDAAVITSPKSGLRGGAAPVMLSIVTKEMQ